MAFNYQQSIDPAEIKRLEKGVAILADVAPFEPSIKLAKAISRTLLTVPGLYNSWGDQLYRAAVSVPANIAEAQGRNSVAQRIQYSAVARGSSFEVLGLLFAAPEGQSVGELVDQSREVCRLLDVLVLDLTRQKNGLSD